MISEKYEECPAYWIPAIKKPHPLDELFVAYYGNGSKDIRVVWLNDPRDSAISHWLPLPPLPTLYDEIQDINEILSKGVEI